MASLSKTRSKIFLLLVLLMGGQDLQRILGLICFGVSVGNTNIQDTISATGPEATDKKITTVITGRGWWGEEAEGAGAKGVTGVGA